VTALIAQARAELSMTLRRGDALLLTIGIPVVLLVFFSQAPVLTLPTRHRVDFIAPGVLALCVLSTSMVALGIATGFERGYGVLKRLYVTPLGTARLIVAKVVSVLAVEVLQAAAVCGVAAALGWRPHATTTSVALAVVASVLASFGFAAIGLALAGRLRAEANLAALNGLYLVALLVSGMVIPLSKLPRVLADVARALPSGALAAVVRATLGSATLPTTSQWLVLSAWALGAVAVATLTFRFEPPR
jgi:ABC-2 type transport system permease protein